MRGAGPIGIQATVCSASLQPVEGAGDLADHRPEGERRIHQASRAYAARMSVGTCRWILTCMNGEPFISILDQNAP